MEEDRVGKEEEGDIEDSLSEIVQYGPRSVFECFNAFK